MSDRAAEVLACCGRLQIVVFLTCTAMTNRAVEVLATFELQQICITHCNNLTDRAVEALAKCTRLKYGVFSGCENMTDRAVEILPQCRMVPEYVEDGLHFLDGYRRKFEPIGWDFLELDRR